MHIPIKVDYGVRALVDIALHSEGGPVQAAQIARRMAIPEPYLAQVLRALRTHNMLRSQRGPQGGHSLAMDPSEIRLSDVMACLAGAETLVACLDDTEICVHAPACAQREVWRDVARAVYDILGSTSIADLVARTREIDAARELAFTGAR